MKSPDEYANESEEALGWARKNQSVPELRSYWFSVAQICATLALASATDDTKRQGVD